MNETHSPQRIALVTGAARGIGRACCDALAREGWKVVAAVRDAASTTPFANAAIRVVGCDVADDRQVDALFDALRHDEGRLDALVNNAGVIAPIGRIVDTDPRSWLQALDVNLAGAYRCTRAALPLMIAAGRGVIVNVSSGAAHRPREGWSAYCASKAGLAMLTLSTHEEYGELGIDAVGLMPGVVDTDMQVSIRASGINPISQMPRASLADAQVPARAIAALCAGAASRHRGRDIDVRDAAVAADLLGSG